MKKIAIMHGKGKDILPNATFVRMGIGYLIKRQEEDWSYVKIGF